MLGTGAAAFVLVGGVGVESSANMPIMPTEASVAIRRRVPVLRRMVTDVQYQCVAIMWYMVAAASMLRLGSVAVEACLKIAIKK